MSDISKIVGVDIATIAKINNIAIGDIGSVGGADIPSGFVPVGSPVVSLDSDDLSALSDGDPIETWVNNGSGANLTAAGAERPSFQSDGGSLLNTHPTVNFAAGQQMVSGITLPNDGITVFAVFKADGEANRYVMGAEEASPFTRLCVGADNGPTTFGMWKGSTSVQALTLANLVPTNWYILAVAIAADGSSTFYVNNTTGAGHQSAVTDANLSFALASNTYRGLVGSIANIIVYDSVLSSGDINTNIAGLNTKYSIY